MEFVRIGNASVIMAIADHNASIQNSFVTKFERKKMRSLRSSMTILQQMIRKPFKLFQISLNNLIP